MVGLTQADLVAARGREPAAVTRIHTAYAPALFRFFMAAVGDRHQAEDLTLYDFRRRQAHSPGGPPEDHLGEAAAAASTPVVLGQESGTETALRSGQRTHPALQRLSPREREILGLLARGWSSRRIAEECFLPLNTVRTHVQNVLVKLGVHSKLEAVAFALEHGWTSGPENLDALSMGHLDDAQVVAALQQLSPRPARGAAARHGRRAHRPRGGGRFRQDRRRGQGPAPSWPRRPRQGLGSTNRWATAGTPVIARPRRPSKSREPSAVKTFPTTG
jgi:DNA-binding CsgD family transcriptional regulator